jgi:hypothetical protein
MEGWLVSSSGLQSLTSVWWHQQQQAASSTEKCRRPRRAEASDAFHSGFWRQSGQQQRAQSPHGQRGAAEATVGLYASMSCGMLRWNVV